MQRSVVMKWAVLVALILLVWELMELAEWVAEPVVEPVVEWVVASAAPGAEAEGAPSTGNNSWAVAGVEVIKLPPANPRHSSKP